MMVFSTFGPNSRTTEGMVGSWFTSVVLLGLAGLYHRTSPERLDQWAGYALIALIGAALCCAMNYVTQDPSAGGQAFLAFPVLWGGVNLRRAAVAVVTAGAVVGDATVLFHLEPVGDAISDLSFVGAVLTLMAVMLVRSGETQD